MFTNQLLAILFALCIAYCCKAQEFPNTLTKGAYATFEELQQNKPSITDSFYLELKPRETQLWIDTYSVTPRYASNNKRVKRIWGFFDGSDVYVLHQGEYFKLQRENNTFSFYGYGPYNTDGEFYAGLVGGFIGGSIAAAAEQARISKMKVKYEINQETGEAVIPGIARRRTNNKHVQKLILYRGVAKQVDEPINVLVNDSLEYVFFPNSYAKLFIDTSFQTVSVCYGEDMKTCEDIKLSQDENENRETYVSCSYSTKTQQYEIIQMRHSKGEYESYKPKKEQQKQGPLLPTIAR